MRNTSAAARRKSAWAGPSPVTALIIGLALVIWFAQVVPSTLYSECAYAAYWVSGWFSFTSLFQWTVVAIVAATVLWLVSFLDREQRRSWGEKLAQGAVILALAFWAVAIKSFLFPFASPPLAHTTMVVNALFPTDVRLETELASLDGPDAPQRPNVEFENHPLSYPAINRKTGEIFTSGFSPTGADMRRLEQCLAEQKRALAQYEKDRETLRAFMEDEFRAMKPVRPRDWRDQELDERPAGERE
ncbi:MAG: hypothetical protein A3E78_01775 [Alphaproteobacteria bacterium RIFCSPHIGHO2_12_FULL_63_12]|nr:MAG: hypothetical protein A3E78_01775 [Alphaproteobacteria bacterium RIFCSPHIGHO2_12_FULL_63_12]